MRFTTLVLHGSLLSIIAAHPAFDRRSDDDESCDSGLSRDVTENKNYRPIVDFCYKNYPVPPAVVTVVEPNRRMAARHDGTYFDDEEMVARDDSPEKVLSKLRKANPTKAKAACWCIETTQTVTVTTKLPTSRTTPAPITTTKRSTKSDDSTTKTTKSEDNTTRTRSSDDGPRTTTTRTTRTAEDNTTRTTKSDDGPRTTTTTSRGGSSSTSTSPTSPTLPPAPKGCGVFPTCDSGHSCSNGPVANSCICLQRASAADGPSVCTSDFNCGKSSCNSDKQCGGGRICVASCCGNFCTNPSTCANQASTVKLFKKSGEAIHNLIGTENSPVLMRV